MWPPTRINGMIICRTPFRISFFGGGTDYPAWYRQHGGAVLAATIDKYCYLTCRYLPPFFEHRYPHRLPQDRDVPDDRRDQPPGRARDAALPAASTAASSCTTTATCRPAAAWAPARPSPSACCTPCTPCAARCRPRASSPRRASTSSRTCFKETVGSQDQVMAAYGGLRHVKFHPDGEIASRPADPAARARRRAASRT